VDNVCDDPINAGGTNAGHQACLGLCLYRLTKAAKACEDSECAGDALCTNGICCMPGQSGCGSECCGPPQVCDNGKCVCPPVECAFPFVQNTTTCRCECPGDEKECNGKCIPKVFCYEGCESDKCGSANNKCTWRHGCCCAHNVCVDECGLTYCKSDFAVCP
jgi:hypothetical protein